MSTATVAKASGSSDQNSKANSKALASVAKMQAPRGRPRKAGLRATAGVAA